ncbi:MAG TPA: hypothetical protein VK582_24440 [Pyrinomonadaceae bacterium]|nr:hypothetical protein [Pyrinomonadaceae bacterium]
MLSLYRDITLGILLIMVVGTSCLAQPTTSRRPSAKSSARSRDVKNEGALKALDRLRAIRDCWIDPYAMLPYDEPKQKGEGDFYGCGAEYPLRLAEAQAAVADLSKQTNNALLAREANAAIGVFNDLDTLRKFFNRSGLSSLLESTRVSDIYPIIHKYNLTYTQNLTTKGEIYRQIMPHRRVNVDQFAALIANVPVDSNPTLTPEQATAANDDLTWNRVQRDMSYEWYLRAYPNGRHAAEARQSVARKSEIQKERNDQIERIRADLEPITRKVLEAYVRGDKETYGSFLSDRFPSRALYIARLKPQTEVASFEIKDFEVKRYNPDYELYQATMNVYYRSVFNKEREYHNTLLFLKTERGWQIIEWH